MTTDLPNQAADPDSLRDILCAFESIGDNCEFGLVQRRAGAEPLGLLRFAFAGMDALQTALAERFAGIDDIGLSIDSGGEVEMNIRPYGFVTHTWIRAADAGEDLGRARLVRRNAFLRERLLSQLRSGEKILVRKSNGGIDRSEISRLLGLLRGFGPNTLLWVTLADSAHPPGHVETIEPGLLRGHVARFAPYDDAPDLSFACWASVCRAAFRIRHAPPGHATRKGTPPASWSVDFTKRLGNSQNNVWIDFRRDSAATSMDALGRLQTAEPHAPRYDYDPAGKLLGLLVERAATNLIADADGFSGAFRPGDGAVLTRSEFVPPLRARSRIMLHRLNRAASGPACLHYISAGLVPGGVYCLSFWIWIPHDFRGTAASAVLNGFATIAGKAANPALRGTWQRSWCSARVLPGLSCADPGLFFAGEQGDQLYTTCWQLEAGASPTSYVPTRGRIATRGADTVSCVPTNQPLAGSAGGTFLWEGSLPENPEIPSPIFKIASPANEEICCLAICRDHGLAIVLKGGKPVPLQSGIPENGERLSIRLELQEATLRIGASIEGRIWTFKSVPAGITIGRLHLNAADTVHHAKAAFVPHGTSGPAGP